MADEIQPRDAKIVHLLLASMGITSYQDQVPLQLLDFAHRYTTQVLQDAQVYSDYAHQSGASQPAGMNPTNSALTIDDLKLAVMSRVAFQFKPTTPKDLLVTLAAERNKRNLPAVPASYGLRLPPEKHCLTGNDRDLDDDDDVMIAGYEKIDLKNTDEGDKEDFMDSESLKEKKEGLNNDQDSEKNEDGKEEGDKNEGDNQEGEKNNREVDNQEDDDGQNVEFIDDDDDQHADDHNGDQHADQHAEINSDGEDMENKMDTS